MSRGSHAAVPVGIKAGQWSTIAPERTVLVVAHNVTTITRLLDVLPVFDSDLRVQVVVSWSGSDPFRHGVAELLERTGVITIPWEQAKQLHFDLVVAASHHGSLTDLSGPIVVLSHGIGYTKYSPGNRKPETGNRKPETGNRKPETGNRQTFGLSPQWVLYDGRPFASALGLSHADQLDALAASAPEALSVAKVVGDPCYDRILASRTQRERYRRALGTGDRTLIVVSSTWGPGSLLGSWPDLVRRLLAELPMDSHQVALALHPNTWHGHGPWQIRCWLADCLRSGLTLLPEIDGWRNGLIAADLLIGDHGSVTGYGAAIGVPTALAAFPDDDVAPGTPISALGSTAPRLNPAKPLRDQLDEAIARHTPADVVAERVTSAPGEALHRLRSVCYDVLGLPEPTGEPPLLPLPVAPIPAEDRPPAAAFQAAHTADAQLVRLSRRPAELATPPDQYDDLHVSCPHDYPLRTIRASAAVLTCQRAELPTDAGTWLQSVLDHQPVCRTAAVLDEGSCLIRTRPGAQFAVRGTAPPDVLVSAVHAWLAESDAAPQEITIDLDGNRHRATITPA